MAASPREALVRGTATYQDVIDAPAHLVAEIVDGTLHTHPRPARPHVRASSVLGGKIGGPFDYDAGGPGGWWIIDEPELHLGEDVLVPDLAGWRRERMPEFSGPAHFPLAPDWVCEVLSASTRKVDLQGKRPIYVREGAVTFGSSTRRTGPWRHSSSGTGSGSSSDARRTTSRSASAPSMRSRSAWGTFGHECRFPAEGEDPTSPASFHSPRSRSSAAHPNTTPRSRRCSGRLCVLSSPRAAYQKLSPSGGSQLVMSNRFAVAGAAPGRLRANPVWTVRREWRFGRFLRFAALGAPLRIPAGVSGATPH